MKPDADLKNLVLGKTAGTIYLPDQAAIRAASSLLAAQATQGLRIFSRDLDAALYDHDEFLESARRLALHNPRSPIQILLVDTEPALHQGNRLIELARQVPSRMEIRCVPTEFHDHHEAFLIVDDEGYVLRPVAEVFEGHADFSSPRQVRYLHNEFEYIWERSTRPIELITFGRGL